MKTKCLNCDNEVSQTDGKRERLYCSDNCRAEFNQKKKRKTMSIPMETWQSSVIEFKECAGGQWNLSDGRKGDFVWAKDETKVEANHVYLPPKEDVLTVVEETTVEHKKPTTLNDLKAICPSNLSGFEKSAWISEKRKEFNI